MAIGCAESKPAYIHLGMGMLKPLGMINDAQKFKGLLPHSSFGFSLRGSHMVYVYVCLCVYVDLGVITRLRRAASRCGILPKQAFAYYQSKLTGVVDF